MAKSHASAYEAGNTADLLCCQVRRNPARRLNLCVAHESQKLLLRPSWAQGKLATSVVSHSPAKLIAHALAVAFA